MPNVLVVHDNVGFQLWLAVTLTGYVVIPAKTPSQALKLIERLELPVDLLIAERGVSGQLIETLRQSQGYLHVLSVTCEMTRMSEEEWQSLTRHSLCAVAHA